MSEGAPQLVFVYGTLLKGERYHSLLAQARFVGAHVTARSYSLYDLGEYPALTLDGVTAVRGEVYEVSLQTLLSLDELEEVPLLYTRGRLPTPYGAAYVYLLASPPLDAVLLPHGDWRRKSEPSALAP